MEPNIAFFRFRLLHGDINGALRHARGFIFRRSFAKKRYFWHIHGTFRAEPDSGLAIGRFRMKSGKRSKNAMEVIFGMTSDALKNKKFDSRLQ